MTTTKEIHNGQVSTVTVENHSNGNEMRGLVRIFPWKDSRDPKWANYSFTVPTKSALFIKECLAKTKLVRHDDLQIIAEIFIKHSQNKD